MLIPVGHSVTQSDKIIELVFVVYRDVRESTTWTVSGQGYHSTIENRRRGKKKYRPTPSARYLRAAIRDVIEIEFHSVRRQNSVLIIYFHLRVRRIHYNIYITNNKKKRKLLLVSNDNNRMRT